MARYIAEGQLTDWDRQQLAVVRAQAAALGRMPTKAELRDYECLRRRFGNWPNIMICAGLKETKAVRRAKNRERDQVSAERRMALVDQQQE